jgi:hypothetical protein
MAPVTTWEEKNTGNNLPAQVEIYADSDHSDEYNFLFIAKGGGSANKSFLYQETKAILNPTSFMNWLDEKLRSIGTAACPPYHLAIVIGGTSAEHTVKTAKLASTKYLDSLPTSGDAATGHGFRDIELEEKVLELTRTLGIAFPVTAHLFLSLSQSPVRQTDRSRQRSLAMASSLKSSSAIRHISYRRPLMSIWTIMLLRSISINQWMQSAQSFRSTRSRRESV